MAKPSLVKTPEFRKQIDDWIFAHPEEYAALDPWQQRAVKDPDDVNALGFCHRTIGLGKKLNLRFEDVTPKAKGEDDNDYGKRLRAEGKKPKLRIVDTNTQQHSDKEDDDDEELSLDDTETLKEMNDKHAFIRYAGNKPMVLCLVYNDVFKQEIIELVDPKHIEQQYCNETVFISSAKGMIIPKNKGKWWLGHAERREYHTLVFDPAAPVTKVGDGSRNFNLWTGFSVEPKQGTWKRTLKHIYMVLCNSDPDKFRYVVRWLAWKLQNPGELNTVGLAFKGKKGTGKTFLSDNFTKLFGRHGIMISNREHLTGKHMGHFINTCAVGIEEAYYPGDIKGEGSVKTLLTAERIAREAKYKNAGLDRNRCSVIMTTNEDWVISATIDERRWFINEVEETYAKGVASDNVRTEYFDALWAEIKGDGLAAMLFDLRNMKLGKWQPWDSVPETAEMRKQRERSLDRYDKLLHTLLLRGELPYIEKQHADYGKYICDASALYNCLKDINERADEMKIGEKMRKVIGITKDETFTKWRRWVVPSLQECRANWDKHMGAFDWDNARTDNWRRIDRLDVTYNLGI